MLIFFSVTIFAGAALLFLVQPMFARMVLPLLGGSPAVWNTAMVFYQAMLLAGYAYAHFTTRWLGVRRQAAWHFVVLLAPLLVLPIGLPHGWTPPTGTNPAWWLLAVLAVSVGLPFFVVSASSPLLQRWFSASGHRWAADPYFLYAASNLGSLLALVSYPVLVEPRLRLAEQNRWWAVGYAGFVVLTAMCGVWIRRVGRKDRDPQAEATRDDGVRITARRRFRWVLLAFVPCSLMLSVTTYVTSEIVPIPLLWVIPLGIYLLTFILVFARRRRLLRYKRQLEVVDDPVHRGIIGDKGDDLHRAAALKTKHAEFIIRGHVRNSHVLKPNYYNYEIGTCPLKEINGWSGT